MKVLGSCIFVAMVCLAGCLGGDPDDPPPLTGDHPSPSTSPGRSVESPGDRFPEGAVPIYADLEGGEFGRLWTELQFHATPQSTTFYFDWDPQLSQDGPAEVLDVQVSLKRTTLTSLSIAVFEGSTGAWQYAGGIAWKEDATCRGHASQNDPLQGPCNNQVFKHDAVRLGVSETRVFGIRSGSFLAGQSVDVASGPWIIAVTAAVDEPRNVTVLVAPNTSASFTALEEGNAAAKDDFKHPVHPRFAAPGTFDYFLRQTSYLLRSEAWTPGVSLDGTALLPSTPPAAQFDIISGNTASGTGMVWIQAAVAGGGGNIQLAIDEQGVASQVFSSDNASLACTGVACLEDNQVRPYLWYSGSSGIWDVSATYATIPLYHQMVALVLELPSPVAATGLDFAQGSISGLACEPAKPCKA